MDLSKYAKPIIDEWREVLNLTDEEESVFSMLAKGKSRQQIAFKLHISERTVERRTKRIREKMDQVRGRDE